MREDLIILLIQYLCSRTLGLASSLCARVLNIQIKTFVIEYPSEFVEFSLHLHSTTCMYVLGLEKIKVYWNNLQAGKLQVFAQVLTGFYNSLIIEKKDAYTLVNTAS